MYMPAMMCSVFFWSFISIMTLYSSIVFILPNNSTQLRRLHPIPSDVAPQISTAHRYRQRAIGSVCSAGFIAHFLVMPLLPSLFCQVLLWRGNAKNERRVVKHALAGANARPVPPPFPVRYVGSR